LGYDRGINRLERITSLLVIFHEMMIKMKGRPSNLSSSKAKVQSKTTGGIGLWRILLSLCAVHMREQCDSEKQIYLEISMRLHVLSILQYEKMSGSWNAALFVTMRVCMYVCMYVCMCVSLAPVE
jgi:hypothetical protein